MRLIVLFYIIFSLPVLADHRDNLAKGITSEVVRIVDGDTVKLADGTVVRLVGIQAPKLPLNRPGFKAWPMGTASRDALEKLIMGKNVTLYYGGRRVDRYGRALAHLFRGDGLWAQGEMLGLGMARVYSFADNRALIAQMMQKEDTARTEKTGIWHLPFYQVKDQATSSRYTNSFQVIRGRVKDVATVKGTTYLNFGEDWKSDFTIVIRGKDARRFRKSGIDFAQYKDKNISVRGWLKYYNGPMIRVTHPEQIVTE